MSEEPACAETPDANHMRKAHAILIEQYPRITIAYLHAASMQPPLCL